MSSLRLPHDRRQKLWSRIPDLITDAGLRTLKPGTSKFTLSPTRVRSWPDFAKEVKALVEPYCGKYEAFNSIVAKEFFTVANELGVQGRFVNNVLHPVGEKGQKRKRGLQKIKKAKSKLIPDIVMVDRKTHTIRVVGEAKTFWTFAPKKRQTWHNFLSAKLGQVARYMDDHYCRYGFLTTYEHTWFVKRQDDTHFLMSPPISATAQSSAYGVSLRECLFATAIRAADDKKSDYGVRCGPQLTLRRYTPSLIGRYSRRHGLIERYSYTQFL
ncbi:uncharacterized protein BO87DRAFT_399406 [Aspergillus neoniger CBS 115656]|uniref:Fungal-type protein kinase domain-containing protein n=1 Tax=Aspergillus neoniger (strain CBS 115656) TaxID=1448310 RepID=A0A318YUQ0_ASPNB|nr:hypothetical protein BO87DRAFT_399406 [Aspergillus neoniger CBS 115656]PYH31608.1 hypothetical protein BO87DRAFT_399406 [Aspergillus neoniger CBS 115656]